MEVPTVTVPPLSLPATEGVVPHDPIVGVPPMAFRIWAKAGAARERIKIAMMIFLITSPMVAAL